MATLITDSLSRCNAQVPDKPVASWDGCEYSFSELYRQSCLVAAYWRACGLQAGDRVAIVLENSWPVLPAIFGSLYAGAVFSVISNHTRPGKLSGILEDSGARFLITDTNTLQALAGFPEPVSRLAGVLCTGEEPPCDHSIPNLALFASITMAGEQADEEDVAIAGEDLACLLYTSGSTGEPKGVMLSHANLAFTSGSICQYLQLDEASRIHCALPFSFGYGLFHIFLAIRSRCRLIISRSFTYPGTVFQEILAQSATLFPAVPTVFGSILASHATSPLCFPSVRTVTSAAAALPPHYVQGLQDIFPNARIYLMYGLSECTRVCYLDPDLLASHAGSVGTAIPGTSLMLLDDRRNPVPPGEIGTLYVRGKHIMQGYWNKPEATAQMLVTDLIPGETVLCAQDQFVQDEQGLLYFKGRVDGVVKVRGEKVSLVEVENALYGFPGVIEAAVIAAPDSLEGHRLKAFVVLQNPELQNPELQNPELKTAGQDERERKRMAKAIQRHCAGLLESHMVPREIEFRAALPRTASNKIRKMDLH